MDRNIVISLKTILVAFLAFVGIYVLYSVRNTIGLVFFALLITLSLEHTIQFVSKQRLFNNPIPRSLAVLITYVGLLLILILGLSVGFEPLRVQSQKLITTLSKYQNVISIGGNIDISVSEIFSGITSASGGVINATKSIFSNVTTLFSVLILAVYMSADWENLKARIVTAFPEKYRHRAAKTIIKIEFDVGLWLRGQAILMVVIGIISYIGLLIIGVEFPLALGIIAGILEIIPLLGPVLAAIVASFVALTISPLKALLVIALFTVIQQLENNLLVPKIMQKVSGFSPITIIIALLIGSELFGIVGAIVAVPVTMVGSIVLKEIL